MDEIERLVRLQQNQSSYTQMQHRSVAFSSRKSHLKSSQQGHVYSDFALIVCMEISQKVVYAAHLEHRFWHGLQHWRTQTAPELHCSP
jgi:hypothetical protein